MSAFAEKLTMALVPLITPSTVTSSPLDGVATVFNSSIGRASEGAIL